MTEYRLQVVQEGSKRVSVTAESRQPGGRWRKMFTGAGEDVYQALVKLGKEAERIGEIRANLLSKVGR